MTTFDELALVNYQKLQIYINSKDEAQRLQCHYVGCIPNKGIILTLPKTPDGKISPQARLKTGDSVSFKTSTSNGLASFSGNVLAVTPSPFPLLHIAYPRVISFNNVRKDPRVDISLPLEMTFSSGIVSKGTFSDISISGGRIFIQQAGAEVGDQVRIRSKLTVAGQSREIELAAAIRTCLDIPKGSDAINDAERVYGVEFTDKDELKSLIVSAFINGELAKRHKAL